MLARQTKIGIDEIKALSHTLLIPTLLTVITSNILYATAYLLFITFIYTKVKTDTPLSDNIQFISKILLTIILATISLILIAANADFLTGIIK